MDLAKQHLDVGLMVNDWDAAQRFWADTVGVAYEHFEKLGGGMRQYRFGAHGSVIKVNHARNPLPQDPTVHRRLRLAGPGRTSPLLVRDPEGVEVELVPPGHDGVAGIEVINASAAPAETERFWVEGLGATIVEPGRYRIGDSLVRIVHEPNLEAPTTRTAAGFRYLTVQVFDVDAEHERLTKLGFASDVAPVSLGTTARICMVRDPDGGYVEVSQRAEVTGRPIPPGTPGTTVPH